MLPLRVKPKTAGVDHLIFISVADAELFDERCTHIKTKLKVEEGIWREIFDPTSDCLL